MGKLKMVKNCPNIFQSLKIPPAWEGVKFLMKTQKLRYLSLEKDAAGRSSVNLFR